MAAEILIAAIAGITGFTGTKIARRWLPPAYLGEKRVENNPQVVDLSDWLVILLGIIMIAGGSLAVESNEAKAALIGGGVGIILSLAHDWKMG